MERLAPKELRRYKKGTLVTGYDEPAGLWIRPSCKGHVWQLLTRSKVVHPDVDPQQAATCLVCEHTIPPVSIRFWQQKVTKEYLMAAVKEVKCQTNELDNRAERLLRLWRYRLEQRQKRRSSRSGRSGD